MAVIAFITKNNKAVVTISGEITPSTSKLIDAYTKKHKLDVESTTIKDDYGFTPSYQQK